VGSGSIQPVPLELVHTRYTEPPPLGDGFFVRTTTGLACHTSVPKAFLHGLLECIERDAIARAFVTHGFFERMRLGGSTSFGSRTSQLLERVQGNGLSIALWHAPSPTGMPVVWCQTIETGPGEPMLSLPTEGYAAGGNLDAAASSALLEALVTRAGAISGARDDQTRRHYRASTDAYVAQARELITTEAPSTGDGAIETSGAEDLGTLVQAVIAAGLGPILTVPVGSEMKHSVHCIRTILPGAQPFATVR
jgi:ribosomal protein S12 methylthiotransferase accessory factor